VNNYAIDRDKWALMGILDQMANIYSEVGRTINAKKSGDDQKFRAALTRAIDLFNATIEVLNKQKSPRMREVLLAKYQFLSLFYAKTRQEDVKNLERYFMQFAIAARIAK
jgi:flagellin-specific chaperone FliS